MFSVGIEILNFSQKLGHSVNGFGILPHLYNNRFYRLIIQFGVVLLFCNAPFVTSNSNFVIIRTGYKKWFCGQIAYIFLASLLYTAFVVITILLPLLPNLTFESSWGIVLSTLSQVSNTIPRVLSSLRLRLNTTAMQ
jgi:hypothetical protein